MIVRLLASANCSLTGNTVSDSCTNLPKVSATSSTLHNILAIFFGIAGVLSLLMIVIGALMFVTSGGNPQQAAKARQTVIFAVIGLAVSLLAEAFVAFVLVRIK
ncbi:MAG: hypothetical protein ACYCPS_01740 [Candidatus Saccharimonadales bacterium]